MNSLAEKNSGLYKSHKHWGLVMSSVLKGDAEEGRAARDGGIMIRLLKKLC